MTTSQFSISEIRLALIVAGFLGALVLVLIRVVALIEAVAIRLTIHK
jgi:hypothetical protein